MSKTYKDDKDYREVTKPAKSNRRKLTYEEKLELKKIREETRWRRMMEIGFS